MKKLFLLLLVFIPLSLLAQSTGEKINYFMPKIGNFTYNSEIKTPAQFLGFEIADRHITTHEFNDYLEELQTETNRIKVEYHGKTHGNRKITYVTITSKANHDNIDKILENHHKISDPTYKGEIDYKSMPIVIWLGYSIHGNEASAVNGALAVSYFLAAAEGEEIDNMLKDAVIIMHPAINPDGSDRFANWVNSNRSFTQVIDPASREFNEPWPSSRANYYWFDLNRDVLYIQHPESRSKAEMYLKWRPNVVNDHHEQNSNNNYFFMPGVKSRTNSITHEDNWELTSKISKYHAKELNTANILYYAEDSFDDFYYGKGSTYPDLHGAIGMLFEQASARGHVRMTENGIISLALGSRSQAYTSYSTIRASLAMREELLRHQRASYVEAYKESQGRGFSGYVFGTDDNEGITTSFIDILLTQDIDVYKLNKDFDKNGVKYTSNKSYYVPVTQKEVRKLTTIFDNMTEMQDSAFYDITAWTLTESSNMRPERVKEDMRGEKLSSIKLPEGKLIGGESPYVYLFENVEYNAHKAIYELQKAGVKLEVAATPFNYKSGDTEKLFRAGTVLVHIGNQSVPSSDIYALMQKISKENAIDIYSVATGAMQDTYFGNKSFMRFTTPKVAQLIGKGASSLVAGEIWFLLDQRLEMPLGMIDNSFVNHNVLAGYNTLVVTGNNDLTKNAKKVIKTWVKNGGTIIAIDKGWKLTNELGITNLTTRTSVFTDYSNDKSYSSKKANVAGRSIGGVILEANIDITHPLAWGYDQKTISLLHEGTEIFNDITDKYNAPLKYTDSPVVSGYVSKDNAKNVAGASTVFAGSYGSGKVIVFGANPNFRGFWYGTQKLFFNSLFFDDNISAKRLESVATEK